MDGLGNVLEKGIGGLGDLVETGGGLVGNVVGNAVCDVVGSRVLEGGQEVMPECVVDDFFAVGLGLPDGSAVPVLLLEEWVDVFSIVGLVLAESLELGNGFF